MWPYTDEEIDWLEARKADVAAGKPVIPEPELVAYYVREAERLRAEATVDMVRMIGRAIAGAFRRPADSATLRSDQAGPLPTG